MRMSDKNIKMVKINNHKINGQFHIIMDHSYFPHTTQTPTVNDGHTIINNIILYYLCSRISNTEFTKFMH